jgi:hypothetical protein
MGQQAQSLYDDDDDKNVIIFLRSWVLNQWAMNNFEVAETNWLHSYKG